MGVTLGRQVRRLQRDLVEVRQKLADVEEHEAGMMVAYEKLAKAISYLACDAKGNWSIGDAARFKAAMNDALAPADG